MAELVIRRGLEEPDTSSTFVPHKPQRPEKVEGGKAFRIVSEYQPSGDQPGAIAELTEAALAAIPSWMEDYNDLHPHSRLGYRSPREYIRVMSQRAACPV